MPKMFKRHFNTLGFRSPRWFKVNHNLFNPSQWARYRIRHLHELISRFQQKGFKKQDNGKLG